MGAGEEQKFDRQRKQLVAALAERGITDRGVLHAIATTPRHLFMPPDLVDVAYVDKAFPIGLGQTISQPYTVAYQTQLLRISAGDKVLEIGTGSGYQAAILAAMGATVYTIERQKKLFDKLGEFPYIHQIPHLYRYYGDGYEGLPEVAPFHRILITAAAPVVPPNLLHQLEVGGIMVLPLQIDDHQRMIQLVKEHDGNISETRYDHFTFVPMLRGKET